MPSDWGNWFPTAVPLRLDLDVTEITVDHLCRFAIARLQDREDPLRFLEAAQCLLLLHHLGAPAGDTQVVSVHG